MRHGLPDQIVKAKSIVPLVEGNASDGRGAVDSPEQIGGSVGIDIDGELLIVAIN